jgi:hypothetical protein
MKQIIFFDNKIENDSMKKTLILTILTISLCVNLFAQKDKYPSKEQDEYYKNLSKNFVPFKPLDTAFILGFKPEYYEIHESGLNYEPYSPEKYLTPYQDSIRKIEDAVFEKIRSIVTPYQNSKELPDSINNVVEGLFESLNESRFSQIEYIGKVERYSILKHEKKDNIEAFIYANYEYEELFYGGGPGIWIGYSENSGKDWKYYYTGIVQGQPVFVKHYSQRALIKEKDKLEIEACLLRQTSSFCHPIGADFECVKDGIYIVFDMNVIAQDSDGDGLTDIVEEKLYLDKYNKDTNNDGIPDNLDMNPRVYFPRTEKTRIYEAILNDEIDWKNKKIIGKLSFNEHTTYNVTDSTETVLIITDDKDLMGIQPRKYRVIFITSDEYENKAKPYNMNPRSMSFSPLFKVDKRKNTYKLFHSFGTGGVDYLIRKTKKGWTIKMLSVCIS